MKPRPLLPLDPDYPSRLRASTHAPAPLIVRGGSLEATCCVAVVGSRQADPGATRFARALAGALVDAGAVVVSGGARGVDAAAHRGALARGGRTWVVAGTPPERCYPKEHAALFERIGRGPGAVLWPFPPGTRSRSSFLVRNRVLVTLADAIVVVQAAMPSGALHAAQWARALKKRIWVVPPPPWDAEASGGRPPRNSRPEHDPDAHDRIVQPDRPEAGNGGTARSSPVDRRDRFAGSRALLGSGAAPLLSIAHLLGALELGPSLDPPCLTARRRRVASQGARAPSHVQSEAPPFTSVEPRRGLMISPESAASPPFSADEIKLLAAISTAPLHHDAIAIRAGLSAQATSAGLLTLALEDVVVEGPPGFFRRPTAAGTG